VPVYFADTSALAKRYINEAGSAWLRGLLNPSTGCETFIVRLAAVELIAAITRRERTGSLSSADAAAARAAFRADLTAEYQVVEVTEALIERAMALAEAHGVRGYDALHLAAALEVNALLVTSALPPLVLVSADTELNGAAMAAGMVVEDPNAHP
jgi:predicted nucleic acid-binding protein